MPRSTDFSTQGRASWSSAGRQVFCWFFVMFGRVPTVQAQVPIGPEFAVNVVTTGDQSRPSVASDSAGRFLVGWSGVVESPQLMARRFDASGRPSGGEFQVNSSTEFFATGVKAAFDASGAFVVAWGEVYARRFDAAGVGIGPQFQVNVYTTGTQRDTVITAGADGNFVVLWADEAFDGHGGVFARLFDAAGEPVGGEFQVTSGDAGDLGVAPQGGGFVVTWTSVGDGSYTGVFGRRYEWSGLPVGPQFQVNTYTTDLQVKASVASDANGGFVVVWESFGPSGIVDAGIFGQRYDASGAPLGGEFHVNSYTDSGQTYPAVAAAATGEFMVTWQHFLQDGSAWGLSGRLYDRDGVPLGPEFPVNAHTPGSQWFSDVAAGAAGTFVVVWESDQSGLPGDLVGRRFGPDAIFADDFDTGALSAWSTAAADGGDLRVSAAAALNSTTWGLEAFIDDTAGLYVQDDRPQDESRYRARFYFDPNTFDPGEAAGHRRTRLFVAFSEGPPQRRVVALVIRRLGGQYAVMARARLDDNTRADTGFFAITDEPHAIELDLVRATGPDAPDGSLQLFVDGVAQAQLPGLDNSRAGVDVVRLGALSVKAGASGTLYFDDFVSRRQSAIGLVP